MSTASLAKVVAQLRSGSRGIGPAAESDGQQLQRFLTHRDEAALAGLIRRHGPMVFAVCQRILEHHADSEDAFQAAFLVLVRKAHQVQPAERVGAWLHGVARRVACFAKKTRARRRETPVEMAHMPNPARREVDTEILAILDDEIQRLPIKYRDAIVLCELEGRTIQTVARQLNLPAGTVASRLHRGRELLAQRMKRYQSALTAGGVATVLAGSTRAALPAGLIQSTAKVGAATAIASGAVVGVSASVAKLTEGAIKLMLIAKIKTTSSAAMALVVMFSAGMVWYSNHAWADEPIHAPPATEKIDDKKPKVKPLTKMQGLWKDLASHDDVKLTKAVLAMAATPKDSLAFLQAELRPVNFDRTKVLKWIADLGSDKPEVHEAAAKELDYLAPLIREDLEDAMDNAANDTVRQRVLNIMLDLPEGVAGGFGGVVVGGAAVPALPAIPVPPAPAPGGGANPAVPPPPPPGGAIPAMPILPPPGGAMIQIGAAAMDDGVSRLSWKRAVRAITILEHIGSPDAVAMLKKIAAGESDAAPTMAAKDALKRLEKQSE